MIIYRFKGLNPQGSRVFPSFVTRLGPSVEVFGFTGWISVTWLVEMLVAREYLLFRLLLMNKS